MDYEELYEQYEKYTNRHNKFIKFYVVPNFKSKRVIKRLVMKEDICMTETDFKKPYRMDGLIYVVDDFDTNRPIKILNPNHLNHYP